MVWISLTLVYGILKGCRELAKKKALTRNTVMEVLILYTLLSFLMVSPSVVSAFSVSPARLPLVALKSLVIFIAWMCSFSAVKKMPISIVGILDMSRVIFSTILGYIVLHEAAERNQVIGMILVCAGLFSLRLVGGGRGDREEKTETKYVILVFVSCILNSVSGTLDKILMKDMGSSQLQFWYLLFLSLFYIAYILVRRIRIDFKSVIKNGWIWALSLMIVIADRCLFIANGVPESRVTVMTLLKQSGCVVTIIGGYLMFKEKNVVYKLLCAAVVITGVFIAVM